MGFRIQLDWVGLGRFGLGWLVSGWVWVGALGLRLGWLGLGRVRSGWLGLGWTGLGWFGLGWVGWGWVGVGFARMHTGTHACTRAGMHVRTPASQIVGVCGCYGEPIAPWLWRADLKPVQEHGAVHMQFCPIPVSSALLYTKQAPCADQYPLSLVFSPIQFTAKGSLAQIHLDVTRVIPLLLVVVLCVVGVY